MNMERTVLVTGFGPFGQYVVNASWEAVKELNKRRDELRERYGINLIIDQISVAYDHVTDKIPRLWKEHDPMIVLHVGVRSDATCLMLEDRAHATGYIRRDVNDKCPTEEHANTSPHVIETGIDVEQLCRKINDKNTADCCTACVSHDAGRYLCEFTFYQSLRIQPERTLFVHVPDFRFYSSQVTADGLYDIIECLAKGL